MPDISYTSLILLKEVNIMKKAQGLPLNTIVIAALVLLVLVILALILTGKLGTFAQRTNECATNGGSCTTAICDANKQLSSFTCPKTASGQAQNCCLAIDTN